MGGRGPIYLKFHVRILNVKCTNSTKIQNAAVCLSLLFDLMRATAREQSAHSEILDFLWESERVRTRE